MNVTTKLPSRRVGLVALVILAAGGLAAGAFALADGADSGPPGPASRATADSVSPKLADAFAVLRADRDANDELSEADATAIQNRPDSSGANPSLSHKSREADGLEFFVIPANDSVCLEATGTDTLGGASASCQDIDAALSGHLVSATLTRGGIRVTGLLPDSASDVELVLANGETLPVPVVNNVYTAEITKSLQGIRFTLGGKEQELATPFEMAPVGEEQDGKVVRVR